METPAVEDPRSNRTGTRQSSTFVKINTVPFPGRWVILVPDLVASDVENLLETLFNVAKSLNFHLERPVAVIKVSNTQTEMYLSVMENTIKKYRGSLDMVFVIIAKVANVELYSRVKKCGLDNGIATQFFLARNMMGMTVRKSIATKVVMQMESKLEGSSRRYEFRSISESEGTS